VYAINLYHLRHVRVYQVQPSEWPGFKSYLETYYRTPSGPPLRPACPRQGHAAGSSNRRPDEVSVDLSPVLEGGLGNLVVIVEPDFRCQRTPTAIGSQRGLGAGTKIGLDAFADHSQMVVWPRPCRMRSTVRCDGRRTEPGEAWRPWRGSVTGEDVWPVSTCRARVQPCSWRARGDRPSSPVPLRLGDDVWESRPYGRLRWYVFDDAHVPARRGGARKGWLGASAAGRTAISTCRRPRLTAVGYRVIDFLRHDIGSGEGRSTSWRLDWSYPAEMPTWRHHAPARRRAT